LQVSADTGKSWQNLQDNHEISGSANDTLLLLLQNFNFQGKFFRCIVIGNCQLSDTSNMVGLAIKSLDTVVIQNGTTLSARCSDASYTWVDCTFGYSAISGDTLREFTPTVDGSYAVIISKNGCTDTSACYFVCLPPFIISQPSDTIVCKGDAVIFTAQAENDTLLQWQFSPDYGSSWFNATDTGNFSGSMTDTLTILTTDSSIHGYNFRCIATGSCHPADTSIPALLQVTTVDTSVSLSGHTLISNALATGYQWVDCNNGFMPVIDSTHRSFTPAQSGLYAVIIQANGCTDTSSCYYIQLVGVKNYDPAIIFLMYPNPAYDFVILSIEDLNEPISLEIRDMQGRLIKKVQLQETGGMVDLSGLEKGIYHLLMMNNAMNRFVRMVKM
jgi:hypothetical protein